MRLKLKKRVLKRPSSNILKRKDILLGMFLLLGTSQAFAQKDDIYSKLRKEYAADNSVYVSRKEDAVIKIENNTPVIYATTYEELLLLTDKTSEYMDRQVYWQDFSSIKDLDARSLIPDGGDKFKTLKVKDFTRTNEISEGTFYDDERAYRFTYHGLTNGSREILSYTERITDPHLYGRFFFKLFAPTDEAEYSITVPQGVKIRYKLFNIKDSIEFTTKQSGKNTIYTWKAHKMDKLKNDEDAPAVPYFAPHIVILLDSYTVNGIEKR